MFGHLVVDDVLAAAICSSSVIVLAEMWVPRVAFGLCTHLASLWASLGFDAVAPLPYRGLLR
jgi:hypothetical protein